MSGLPTGTVTFLFTDLEGSTRLWEEHPAAMPAALARHDAIVHEAVEGHGGVVFSRMGDGVAAAFSSAPDAVASVLEAQHRLGTELWGTTGPLRARMGLHTDEGRLRTPEDYVNRPLNRCARLMAIGHGGQVLVSDATEVLARDRLPDGVAFVDLGDHRLRDLARPVRVFQLTHPDLLGQFPPLRSLDALPGNLPLQPTEFIGRSQELADVIDALAGARLVTLTGVGGVGKTRLALQAAAQVVPSYRDGAWLCELGSIIQVDAVAETVAGALGVRAQAGQDLLDTLVAFLRSKQLLLVLDNCEHLLDPVARLVERIARMCGEVVVLATSREGLGLRGEQMLTVRSLGLPANDDGFDAAVEADTLQLFTARAVESRPGFEVTPENVTAIIDLCRRLDGIPLAIELAAARVRSMSPAELGARLDQRFRLLTGGSRTALERHQTLRGAVDWSYDLLRADERTVLNRLSTFAGSFGLDAAEAVAGADPVDAIDVLDLLAQLVDKSLLVAVDEADATRYRLLETIRQYAQERLELDGDAEDARHRHAEHYVAFVEVLAPLLHGPGQLAAMERMEAEIDNLRALLAWAAEVGDADLALRLTVATNVNSARTSYITAIWAETAVQIPEASSHPLLPDALAWAAWSAVFRNDLDRGRDLVEAMHDAERRLNSPVVPGRAQAPCAVALFSGEVEKAAELSSHWVEQARAEGAEEALAAALTMQASAKAGLGRFDDALRSSEEAVDVRRRLGAPGQLSISLAVLGYVLNQPGDTRDPERALAVLEEAGDIAAPIGNEQALSVVRLQAAAIHREQGDPAAALRSADQAVAGAIHIGSPVQLAASLVNIGLGLGLAGDPETAVMLVSYAAQVLPDLMPPSEVAEMEAIMAQAIAEFGAERVADLTALGAALTEAEAVDLGRTAAQAALDSADV